MHKKIPSLVELQLKYGNYGTGAGTAVAKHCHREG
jgi:hypothetical protein